MVRSNTVRKYEVCPGATVCCQVAIRLGLPSRFIWCTLATFQTRGIGSQSLTEPLDPRLLTGGRMSRKSGSIEFPQVTAGAIQLSSVNHATVAAVNPYGATLSAELQPTPFSVSAASGTCTAVNRPNGWEWLAESMGIAAYSRGLWMS